MKRKYTALHFKLKFYAFCIKFKSLIHDIKFKIQKAYYRIFDHQKYLRCVELEKEVQEIFDILDERMYYV